MRHIKLAIYTEQCTRKGKLALDSRYYGIESTLWDSADYVIYEGTPHELLEFAELVERNARLGGGGIYDRAVARTIRDAIRGGQNEF